MGKKKKNLIHLGCQVNKTREISLLLLWRAFFVKTRRPEEPRAGEPCVCAWEHHGADSPGSYIKAPMRWGGDLRQPRVNHINPSSLLSGLNRWSNFSTSSVISEALQIGTDPVKNQFLHWENSFKNIIIAVQWEAATGIQSHLRRTIRSGRSEEKNKTGKFQQVQCSQNKHVSSTA